MGPIQVQPLRFRVGPGVIATKGRATLSRTLERNSQRHMKINVRHWTPLFSNLYSRYTVGVFKAPLTGPSLTLGITTTCYSPREIIIY